MAKLAIGILTTATVLTLSLVQAPPHARACDDEAPSRPVPPAHRWRIDEAVTEHMARRTDHAGYEIVSVRLEEPRAHVVIRVVDAASGTRREQSLTLVRSGSRWRVSAR